MKQSKTRLYSIWHCMKLRCYNKNRESYKNYGARGIKVCSEWLLDFNNFKNWAYNNGYNDTLTLDRIDNNDDYKPSNCRWVTPKEQQNNTRRNHYILFNGQNKTLKQWSEELDIPYFCLRSRLNNLNWSVEKAFSTPCCQHEGDKNDK